MKYKCWGIGLPRTGTTTFCSALSILGYTNILHDPGFHQLKNLDAASDSCVAINYKYLDYVFPKSKFVLTIRHPNDWLSSIEYIINKVNPSHERIRRRLTLYDTVDFDEEKFLNAYHRHHLEVRKYFEDKPNKLLEIDFSEGNCWNKICSFLELPIPNCNFPHDNKRKSS